MKLYVKTPNEIFARHRLATPQQKPGESLGEYLQELQLSEEEYCAFKSLTAEQYHEELIRDTFINDLASQFIHQRLLENRSVDYSLPVVTSLLLWTWL